jgi:hypothetical protein
MRIAASCPTEASFGPPVSTTRPAPIRPWLVCTVPSSSARPRKAVRSRISTPLRISATV